MSRQHLSLPSSFNSGIGSVIPHISSKKKKTQGNKAVAISFTDGGGLA